MRAGVLVCMTSGLDEGPGRAVPRPDCGDRQPQCWSQITSTAAGFSCCRAFRRTHDRQRAARGSSLTCRFYHGDTGAVSDPCVPGFWLAALFFRQHRNHPQGRRTGSVRLCCDVIAATAEALASCVELSDRLSCIPNIYEYTTASTMARGMVVASKARNIALELLQETQKVLFIRSCSAETLCMLGTK